MADPTPPSDLPDPASATPASPAPKRIRSMPDRPGGVRPAGAVRSVPVPERRGTAYTTGLGNERSWGRGLAILWALFLAALLLEALNATYYVLAGKNGWPLPIEAGRLALVCTFFISLWAGLGWLRYLLATVDVLSAAWLLTDSILSYKAAPKFRGGGGADWTIYSSIESFPKVALGLLYLSTAAYLLFSHDVQEFMIHRRARGRVWSALLVTVVAYGSMLLIFAAQPIYGRWMQGQSADAGRFGEEELRKAAEHWDPTSLDGDLDSAYAKSFTKADRASTFGSFKSLGPLKNANTAPAVARAPMPQYPLQDKVPIPQGINSEANKAGTGFEVTANYTTAGAEFEHGKAKFGFDLVRDLFGPWRVTKLNVENVQYDRPPAPAPTPAADAPPAQATGTVPAPSPALVPSPSVTPATTVAPSPMASTTPTPAATP